MTASSRLLTVPLLLSGLTLAGCNASAAVPDGAQRVDLDGVSVDIPSDWVEQQLTGDDAEMWDAIYHSADGALELRAASPYMNQRSAQTATSIPITSLQVGVGCNGFEITDTAEPGEGEDYAVTSTTWFSCTADGTQGVLAGRMTKDRPGSADDEAALISIVGSTEAFDEADVRSIVDSITIKG